MKLGAQFYSLRERNKTPEGLRNSFKAMKEIGYEVAQMSAICQIEPERLKAISDEFELPITCTHSPFDRILNDTDALIKEHIIYGCPVIGLGALGVQYRDSLESLKETVKMLREPIAKIDAAGLRFAYHNHAFDFDDIGGVCDLDYMIEELPTMNVILDTYWVHYAGKSNSHYIKLLGKDRLLNIHYKDMKSEPKGPICPCGEGIMNFKEITALCEKVGVKNALVEQDNAPDLGDEYEQMKRSFDNLRPIIKPEV